LNALEERGQALAPADAHRLEGVAAVLQDWGAIVRAGDIFSMDAVPIDIGPTRHGITRGTTI
jgi:catechol 2,3-dioxygenase